MTVSIKKTLAICAVLALAPLVVQAEDHLVMKNGDVITGTITAISDGKVTIEPAYSGAFDVDLAEVASMEASTDFEVTLADDRELSGQIAQTEDGQQVIVAEGEEVPVNIANIAAAAEPRPYKEWGALVNFNATFNDGNTDSQSSLLFASGNLRYGEHRNYGDLTFANEETDGVKTKEQTLLNYAYNWMFNDPWYTGATFSYERDPVKDLDNRYTIGAIMGRDIFDEDNRFLTFHFGVGYSDEEIGGVSESGAVGLWNLRYTQTFFKDLEFFHTHALTQQFYGMDNLIFKSNTGVQFNLLQDLFASASLRYDYETEPAPGRSKDDTTLALGLGYKF